MIYFSINNPKTATFALPNWRRLLIRRGRGGARGGMVVEEPGEAGKGFIRRGRGGARGRMAVEERGEGGKGFIISAADPRHDFTSTSACLTACSRVHSGSCDTRRG